MISKLPIGIQDFEKLRKGGYKYIDKTRLLYELISSGEYYFLSRPRRFGKSLFLSTLKSYFEGKKDLFEGLYISNKETEWIEYPVLYLDLNTRVYSDNQSLISELNKHLEFWESLYGSQYSNRAVEERFERIIQKAYLKTGRQVVILVDEYDKPILQAMGNETLQDTYRSILKGFYGALKSCDRYIRFAFLTGVTKFGKVSVFSDLNNLKDISMIPRYYDICGITEPELRQNFSEEVHMLANKIHISLDEAYAKLQENYDGYRFTPETVSIVFDNNGNMIESPIYGIYNPFSIINALQDQEFGNYWFETGTPTYLVELLKKYEYYIPEIEDERMTSDSLNCIDSTLSGPIPVIYQSGYLTIKDYDKESELYSLGFPNQEVEKGFLRYLLPYIASTSTSVASKEIDLFVKSVREKDIDGFMSRLKTLFSRCPYELQPDQERHCQTILYLVFKLCGFYTNVEAHTNVGRMDMVIKTDKHIYIFELKYNKSAEEALIQIHNKGYADGFMTDGREVIAIGVNYSSKERNIDEWKFEVL